jgi:hypothetical protein
MKRISGAVLKLCYKLLVDPPVAWASTGVKPTSDLPERATSEKAKFVMTRLSHDEVFSR